MSSFGNFLENLDKKLLNIGLEGMILKKMDSTRTFPIDAVLIL